MINKIFKVIAYKKAWAKNFLKYLEYVGEFGPDNVQCKHPEVGRKYYKYKKSTSGSSVKSLLATDSDWPFPEMHYKSIGSTVRGFTFFPQTYLIH